MRSLLVAVFEMNVTEIMVIGHYDCGMQELHVPDMLDRMRARGISDERLEILENAGVDFHKWLTDFDCVEDAIMHSVNMIRKHPLMPSEIRVHGLVIHPITGKLNIVVNGNKV